LLFAVKITTVIFSFFAAWARTCNTGLLRLWC